MSAGASELVEERVRQISGSGGLPLQVQERGPAGAPTIVLVHGFPDDHAVWDLVATPLALAHHVVTYDVRGAGASGAPAARDGYRMERLVEDLAAVVDAVSPDRPVHLVAHDWGSIQAWSAVTDPSLRNRFASLTSMSGPGLAHVRRWIRAHLVPGRGRWTAARRQGLRSWYILAFQSRFAPRFLTRFSWLLPTVIARSEGVATDPRWPGPHQVRNAVNGVGLYQANLRRWSRPDALPSTEIPVQLLVPQQDPYVTPALLDGIEAMAPNLVRRDLGGKHWMIRSKPELIAGLVAAHVGAVEAGRDPEAARTREVVVVTGAGSGIGRSVCLAFAERGAHLIATDLRPDAAARTAELCRLLGATAEHHALDVTDAGAVEDLADLVGQQHGAPTVVVNNAGLGMAGPFLDTTEADWDLLLDVNLRGVIRGARAFGQLMVDTGTPGHIVNVASAAAFSPSRTMSAYATSKAAVLMLSECLRAELADQGIGVSAICPGFVDTGIAVATRYVGATAEEQDARRRSADRLYKRRRVTPDAVADAVLRSVDRGAPVTTVAAEARLARWSQRFTPRLRRAIARIDLTPPPTTPPSIPSSPAKEPAP